MKLGPDHYRFYDTIDEDGVTISCQRYVVIGETPLCWYVVKDYMAGYSKASIKENRKRILKAQGGRKHCYLDMNEAMRSYKIRKKRQIGHAELSMERAKAAHAQAVALLATGNVSSMDVICEGGDYIKELNWESC